MALRCPECTVDNPLGSFYCERCQSPLLPEAMIPPSARRPASQGSEAPEQPAAVPASPSSAESVASHGDLSETPPDTSAHDHLELRSRSSSSRPLVEAAFAETARRYRIIAGDTCPICRAASRISFTRDRPPSVPVIGCSAAGGCTCALPNFDDELGAEAETPVPPRLGADAEPTLVAPGVDLTVEESDRSPPTIAPDGTGADLVAPPSPALSGVDPAFPEMASRYRIVLGDSCPICRAASRITFTRDRPASVPVVGCRDAGGCRCSLPAFAGEPAKAEPAPAPTALSEIYREVEDDALSTEERNARVFGALCDHAVISNSLSYIDIKLVRAYSDLQELADAEYERSLVSLVRRGLIQLDDTDCTIPEPEFDRFVIETTPNYDALVDAIGQRIVSAVDLPRPHRWIAESPRLAATVKEPLLVVEHVLRRLQAQDLLEILQTDDGMRVMSVTPALRQQYKRRGDRSGWLWG